LQGAIRTSNTSQQAMAIARAAGIPLGDIVCGHALRVAREIVPASVKVEMFTIDRQGNITGVAQ
jgi:cobalt-precorrin-5B (C1)-methyltransferase